MGKTALFAIAAFTVMTGYYGLSSQRGMLAGTERISDQQYETMARNAALTGYDYGRQHLVDNGFTQLNEKVGSHGEAEYHIKVNISTDAATGDAIANIRSLGKYKKPTGTNLEYEITATVRETSVVEANEPPAFMKYGIISDQSLTLNGAVMIDTMKVKGSQLSVYNANIHTNGDLTVSGNKVRVRGFGTYAGTASVNNPNRTFKPYHNPAREMVLRQVEPVELVNDLDVTNFTNTYPADNWTGTTTLSGSYDFTTMGATRDDPYVWYVNGDLTTLGNVEIKGYAIFVVLGDILFDGNVEVTSYDPEYLGESNFAFYNKDGNVTIAGTASVLQGQIFSFGNIDIVGNTEIAGSIGALGTITVSGTPSVRYLPPSQGLTKPWQDSVNRPKLVAYAER